MHRGYACNYYTIRSVQICDYQTFSFLLDMVMEVLQIWVTFVSIYSNQLLRTRALVFIFEMKDEK